MQIRPVLRHFFGAGDAGSTSTGSGWHSRAARHMFWTAFAVRLLYITLAHTYRIRVADDHFQFGWEMGRIARALATHRGYADPFAGHSGPTAWTPPLYPLFLAAVFKVFGVYTNSSAWVVLAGNSLASAATAPAIFEIAVRCYRPKPSGSAGRETKSVALWSGWLWALYPAALQYAVHWPWEMALTAMLFTWTTVFALRLRGIGDSSPQTVQAPGSVHRVTWTLWGLFWGLIALSNSSLLTFLPLEVAWLLWPARRRLHAVGRLGSMHVSGLRFALGRSKCARVPCLHPYARELRRGTLRFGFALTRRNVLRYRGAPRYG